MDELIDILDHEGKHTGKTALKSVAHRQGMFHPTVHIWCYTPEGKLLLQQRGENKETHPLLWDVSVAGHVGAGESIIEAAIREVEEEIGLSLEPHNLKKVGVFKEVRKHREDLHDCEFHHTFITPLRVPLKELHPQAKEVAALKLIPLIQYTEEVWGLANTTHYVLHSNAYYKAVLTAIKNSL